MESNKFDRKVTPGGAPATKPLSQGPRATTPLDTPAPAARDAAALDAKARQQAGSSREAVQKAIAAWIDRLPARSRPDLDWSQLETSPRAGIASVSDKAGKLHAFMVRPGADGQLTVTALRETPDEPPPAAPARNATPAAPAAPGRQPTPPRRDSDPSDPAAPADLGSTRKSQAARVGAAVAAQAAAREQKLAKVTDGNAIARSFNSMVDVFTGNREAMAKARDNAIRIQRSELTADLTAYNGMVDAAKDDPTKLAAADDFLRAATGKAEVAGAKYDQALEALSSNHKFWAGTAADVVSGLAVLSGVALCMTGFGAPIGAGLIAGGAVVGGAATIGAHALLDNQYDVRKEGLANFLVGGISSAATVFTAGLGAGAAQFGRALLVREAVVGSSVGVAGAMANEGAQGWQAGWQTRVLRGGSIGAGIGLLAGGVSARVASKFVPAGTQSALAQRAMITSIGAGTGGAAGGAAGLANEAVDGFQDGWQGRVGRQASAGAISAAAYGLAPNLQARNQAILEPRARARELHMPEPVRRELTKKLRELGVATNDQASADQILAGFMEDSVLKGLMRQTLSHEAYGTKAKATLKRYGKEALALDMQTPEGQIRRLQLLTMAMEPETRRLLISTMHDNLRAQTTALKAHLKANPAAAEYDVLAIGAGPNGVNMANAANAAGTHSVLLVGEGLSHFQREGDAFYSNSRNGQYKGNKAAVAGELNNPIYGSPVQPSDMSPGMYNTAGEMGDAAAIGLHHASRGAATDVMIDTSVLSVKKILGPDGQRLAYEATMADGTVVRARKLVIGSGLSDTPNLPVNPATRRVDTETGYVADVELNHTDLAIESNDPAMIRNTRIMTPEQMLTLANRADDPGALFRGQDVISIGVGDGAITSVMALAFGDAPDRVAGVSKAQMGGPGKITMIGEPDLWSRYARLNRVVDSGEVEIIKSTYAIGLRRAEGSERVEVKLQPMRKEPVLGADGQPQLKNGKPVTRSVPDGEAYWRSADRIILATGSKGGVGELMKNVVPGAPDMNWKDLKSAPLKPVMGPDPTGAPGQMEVAYQVAGEDIYTVGVAAPLAQRPGYSWLQDHGGRAVSFMTQLLGSEAPQVGLKPEVALAAPAPLEELAARGPIARLRRGELMEIVRDPKVFPQGKHGDTIFRTKVKLDALLTGRFKFPDLQKLNLCFLEANGKLTMRADGLEPHAAARLRDAIQSDQELVHYLHDLGGMKETTVSIEIGETGRAIGQTLRVSH